MAEKHRVSVMRFAPAGIVAMGILAAVLGSWSCRRDQSGQTESVRIGMTPGLNVALVSVADDRKLFLGNGLAPTFKEYLTSAARIEAMIKGEVDLTMSSEYVVVGQALQRAEIRVIASIVKTDCWYMIGRQDRGIAAVSDLKGKRIGLTRQGSPEFYLGRFLERHGLNVQEMNLVPLTPAQWVEAITGGRVDAVVVQLPYVRSIKEGLAKEAVIWPVQGNQPTYGVISCRNDWIDRHPDLVKRVLKALDQAETYLVHHPKEAQAIVQKRLKSGATQIEEVWPDFQFSLSLDLSLVTAMTEEARWMIDNHLTGEKAIPDFQDYIYIDGLKAVRPEAVNLFLPK